MQQNNHISNNSNRTALLTSLPNTIHATTTTTTSFTNTAKLPIETVKLLIASVSRRPNLWIRNSNGQKRCDINALWKQVSQEIHLPADICRIKWGHLRDNFRKVFIRNTLSGEPPTTWRFYNDMRFMEAAVAENVMRQHRLREQSLYWQELHHAEQKQKSTANNFFELHDNYERNIQNQFGFPDLAAYYESSHEPINKRIKMEPNEANSSLMVTNGFTKSSVYNVPDRNDQDDDEDDDDYDEDAASTEDNYQLMEKPHDLEKIKVENSKDEKIPTAINATKRDISSNAESGTQGDILEHDSDRMFLLSLLPYLRKVGDQRKLKVRQKLQNVLIEEFG
uniref:MADF domain-containing protein n=1 Tax=Glossina palpalis gambiensis TaxID=67801 RepID=A0A1B0BE66_9MUSC